MAEGGPKHCCSTVGQQAALLKCKPRQQGSPSWVALLHRPPGTVAAPRGGGAERRGWRPFGAPAPAPCAQGRQLSVRQAGCCSTAQVRLPCCAIASWAAPSKPS
jgi:hypothetical protein